MVHLLIGGGGLVIASLYAAGVAMCRAAARADAAMAEHVLLPAVPRVVPLQYNEVYTTAMAEAQQ
jgi:hypothetical protein